MTTRHRLSNITALLITGSITVATFGMCTAGNYQFGPYASTPECEEEDAFADYYPSNTTLSFARNSKCRPGRMRCTLSPSDIDGGSTLRWVFSQKPSTVLGIEGPECNGIDDDCDGIADEDAVSIPEGKKVDASCVPNGTAPACIVSATISCQSPDDMNRPTCAHTVRTRDTTGNYYQYPFQYAQGLNQANSWDWDCSGKEDAAWVIDISALNRSDPIDPNSTISNIEPTMLPVKSTGESDCIGKCNAVMGSVKYYPITTLPYQCGKTITVVECTSNSMACIPKYHSATRVCK